MIALALTQVASDYLLAHPSTQAASVPVITIPTLWSVLINGLAIIWPSSRVQVNGVSVGDAWPCKGMPASPPGQPWENIAPFHKVTQSLCYSLMTPMTKLLHVKFAGTELLTGLPEYRNGGLFVDTGLLTLKSHEMERGLKNFRDNGALKGQNSMEVVPLFDVSDSVVVEWRAATVGLLDDLLGDVNRSLGLQGQNKLSLAQMLEAGSWKVWRPMRIDRKRHDSLTRMTGRSRTRRGLTSKHKGAANFDHLRWDGVLSKPRNMILSATLRHRRRFCR